MLLSLILRIYWLVPGSNSYQGFKISRFGLFGPGLAFCLSAALSVICGLAASYKGKPNE
jgi:hypothetical protein